MKFTLACVFALFYLSAFSQTKVVSLENNTGIIQDDLGSITLWENQIDGYGDATQDVSALGGVKLMETYPGKVNVGFSADGSFLELEGTSTSLSDNSYSIFYVGKANPDGKPAALVGNYDIVGTFATCSGIRFVKGSNGTIYFDYAKPNYVRTALGTIPSDDYFFFGFTMDASGNYRYFDSNSSSTITTGTISTAMVPNLLEDLKFNILEENGAMSTYAHTEVVEFSMYDAALSDVEFDAEYTRLATDYADLVASLGGAEFEVTEVLPNDDDFREGISADAPIVITFGEDIDETSVYPKIFINKSETEASGKWVLSPSNVLTFTPTENWPARSLVTLKLQEGLKSTDDGSINLSTRDTYGFIVDAEETFAFETYQLEEPIATIDYIGRTGDTIVGHTLPIKITTPVIDENTTGKFPIHIFVHGGGWIGGTTETSSADYSLHKDYLAKSLGIVTFSISYRCVSSGGTFTYALEDVDRAYHWIIDNADTYNLDTTKIFFSGGSAGTPLAALASQRLPNVIGYIGFNGIYDFVNDAGDYGAGNWFKQDVPSETENSAIFQLSDNPPATLLMHGDADNTISYVQSTNFSDAINTKGGSAETIIYPGEVHSFFSRDKPSHEDCFYEMAKFMTEILEANEPSNVSELMSEVNNFVVYPNPVSAGEPLNIRLNSSPKTVNVEIINQLGQTLQNNTVNIQSGSSTMSVNVDDLKQGHYILKLVTNQTSESLKFVIQ